LLVVVEVGLFGGGADAFVVVFAVVLGVVEVGFGVVDVVFVVVVLP
jgi:hypothetical protein